MYQYLVEDLADAYDRGSTLDMLQAMFPFLYSYARFTNLRQLLAALNMAIADFAFTQFNRLLYGGYRNSRRKGKDAWKFDKQFVMQEQIPTAFNVYDNPAYSEGLLLENAIFNKIGIFAGSDLADVVYIPVYTDQYNSNLTEDSDLHPRYGEEARVLVPLAMLYPNSYFYDDVKGDDTGSLPYSFSISERKFAKTLNGDSKKR